jgi:GTP-binding protein YchF
MLRAGLVGLPASGRTTLFQLLTSVHAASKTSGRAEAHVGVARVPDGRLDELTALFQPRKRVPATVEFADVGAARGDTTALYDVAAYRNADALVHVVRAFRDETVPHPLQTIDLARDARTIEDELLLADLGVVERRLERLAKDLKKTSSPELKKEQAVLGLARETLESGRAIRTLALAGDDSRRLRGFQLLSAKPLLLVVNVDERDVDKAGAVSQLPGLAAFQASTGAGAVGVCAKIELEIAQLDPEDARAFMNDLGLDRSGLERVIRAAYDLLGYISFFTVGDDECRAWSIPRDTRAEEAAGAIHSDIQRGFIRAEVVRCEDLLRRGSLAACREHGELRLEGKEYLVADGDVITFRHAT